MNQALLGLLIAGLSLIAALAVPLWQRRLAQRDQAMRVAVRCSSDVVAYKGSVPEQFEINFNVHNAMSAYVRGVQIEASLRNWPKRDKNGRWAPQHRSHQRPEYFLTRRRVRELQTTGLMQVSPNASDGYFAIQMVGTSVQLVDPLASEAAHIKGQLDPGETVRFKQSSMLPKDYWVYDLIFVDVEGRHWRRQVDSRKVRRSDGLWLGMIFFLIFGPPYLMYKLTAFFTLWVYELLFERRGRRE